jgi:hypothetical protein
MAMPEATINGYSQKKKKPAEAGFNVAPAFSAGAS